MDFFREYLDGITRFFEEKLAALQLVADDQAHQIEALTNKIIVIGGLALLLIILIIILAIALKISSSSKRRRQAREVKIATDRLRREEERLREQRYMYEQQMRQDVYGQDGRNVFDDYGYNEDKFGHGEYRNSWTPDKKRKKAKKKAAKKAVACSKRHIADMFVPGDVDRTTDFYEEFDKATLTAEEREAIRRWDEENRW